MSTTEERTMVRRHHFLRSGYGCAVCPLPKANTRAHIQPGEQTDTVDITEPARRPEDLQLTLPRPRRSRGSRRR